jgi:uncharacterized protein GlcG (DUF336 family)
MAKQSSSKQNASIGSSVSRTRRLEIETLDDRRMMAIVPDSTLTASEVNQLLQRAAAASKSEDAIIAVVDRGGRILGVRTEQAVVNTFAGRPDKLYFAIDGAVAKARTAASFANNAAPLTSRTIRNLSQSTVTEREVNANPNVSDQNVRGPGFVAPIGLGGHFPPDVNFTPPVDLFHIEHQGRDGSIHPGLDGIIGNIDDIYSRYAGADVRLGTADDQPPPLSGNDGIYGTADDLPPRKPGVDGVLNTSDDLLSLAPRFNVKYPIPGDFLNEVAGDYITNLEPPNTWGYTTGLFPQAQGRGFATLPGGIPLYKKNPLKGNALELAGGIGVFFPGPDGYATFEQNFKPNITGQSQTTLQRLNAPKVLEAEWIAYAATGGVAGSRVGSLDGVAPVPGIDLPNGRIDLVGITLELFGPNPTNTNPRSGIATLLAKGQEVIAGFPGSKNSGLNQDGLPNDTATNTRDGKIVPFGWLVNPRTSADGTITASDVHDIIINGVRQADLTRAAIRLNPDGTPGARTKMVLAVADKNGEVLGLYRMPDATIFSIDVAVAKARNTAYYANAAILQNEDKVDDDLLRPDLLAQGQQQLQPNGASAVDLYVDQNRSALVNAAAGLAFTNRTFRFLAEPRYSSGIDGTIPPVFSILTDVGINVANAETIRPDGVNPMPIAANSFNSVAGYDAFRPGTNFRFAAGAGLQTYDMRVANQNGIVFFPGSTPLYKNSILVGGFGVSGDGVDQDDVVTSVGQVNYAPPSNLRADRMYYRNVRLPFQKFNRNPLP